jgi:2-polyprenyl-3-methyl-5-hydroxy-6-metoxy-1,4-benzoquinol methylase
MVNLIHYTSCPVCGSSGIAEIITAKDHTVSKEEFKIFHCANCQLRFTQDVPDATAIGKYYKSEDYISHTDTSKGLINRIYQLVRKRANRHKRKLVEKITGKTKGTLLDIGSGTGYFAAEMKNAGWHVTGLEPDADARKIAEEENQINLSSTDRLFLLPEKSFDVITLWHVLEHVHDLKNYVRKFKNLLKENGKLFVAVPNYKSYDATVYKEYWAAYDVPRHLYHFSALSMEYLMKAEGLKIVAVKPMWFDSFYVSLLSSKYKKGSANWLAAFITGLRSNLKATGDVKKCSSVIYIVSPKVTKDSFGES